MHKSPNRNKNDSKGKKKEGYIIMPHNLKKKRKKYLRGMLLFLRRKENTVKIKDGIIN